MKLRDIEKVFNIKPRECQRLESNLRFYKSMGHYCEKIYMYMWKKIIKLNRNAY